MRSIGSLRARLLLWYTLILAVVIATFAATVCYLFWRSLVADIDDGLQASAAALVSGLVIAGRGLRPMLRPVRGDQAAAHGALPPTFAETPPFG
jgi:hypothetical protein